MALRRGENVVSLKYVDTTVLCPFCFSPRVFIMLLPPLVASVTVAISYLLLEGTGTGLRKPTTIYCPVASLVPALAIAIACTSQPCKEKTLVHTTRFTYVVSMGYLPSCNWI